MSGFYIITKSLTEITMCFCAGGGSIFHLPAMWPGGGPGPDTLTSGNGDSGGPPVKKCARTDPVGRYPELDFFRTETLSTYRNPETLNKC